MSKSLHIGFGNTVVASKIVAIVKPNSSPTKRIIAEAREGGRLVDATEGRKTRSVLVMDGGYIILSGILPETIVARLDEVSEV